MQTQWMARKQCDKQGKLRLLTENEYKDAGQETSGQTAGGLN